MLKIANLAPSAQDGAINFGGFTLTVLGSVITVVNGAWRVLASAPAPPVDEQLRLLAAASRNQWAAAAADRQLLRPAPLPIRWRRSREPVAGPLPAAGYERFHPLPGLKPVRRIGLQAGGKETLHRVYGTLPSGRLLLIGAPGSGKSTAAILLLLDALQHRERATPADQALIPVPVMFTLYDWHPDRGESVIDWMADKLAESYPMFRSRTGRRTAADLLAAGRVAGFLDGLDEIPESNRPCVLEALADAPFRLVLLCRTAEAVDAASHGPLAGAVALELEPVKPGDAATYVLQSVVQPPPNPWRTVSDHLAKAADTRRPASALSHAMTTPLALSLLRDVYGQTDPVDELLDDSRFPAAADIENHLLDQIIIAAYTPRPGRPTPRYTITTAQRTLRYVATELTEHRTTDLAWWHIPTWTTRRSRMIRDAAGTALVNMLLYALTLGPVFGPALGLLAGLAFGAMSLPTTAAVLRHAGPITPKRIARHSSGITVQTLVLGLVSGLTGALLAGLSVGLVSGLAAGLVSGLSVGLASGALALAAFGIARSTELEKSSLGPVDVWRHDRNSGFIIVLAQGLLLVLLAVLVARLWPGLASGLASRLWVALAVGLIAGLVMATGLTVMAKYVGIDAISPGSAVVDTGLAAVQLAVLRKTPLGLIEFLEDARSRHLLRTVGPVYQFRHATLQARLAAKK